MRLGLAVYALLMASAMVAAQSPWRGRLAMFSWGSTDPNELVLLDPNSGNTSVIPMVDKFVPVAVAFDTHGDGTWFVQTEVQDPVYFTSIDGASGKQVVATTQTSLPVWVQGSYEPHSKQVWGFCRSYSRFNFWACSVDTLTGTAAIYGDPLVGEYDFLLANNAILNPDTNITYALVNSTTDAVVYISAFDLTAQAPLPRVNLTTTSHQQFRLHPDLLTSPTGYTDRSGNFYLLTVDPVSDAVVQINTQTGLVVTYFDIQASAGQSFAPCGLAVESSTDSLFTLQTDANKQQTIQIYVAGSLVQTYSLPTSASDINYLAWLPQY